MLNADYPTIIPLFANHVIKGRTESASFLIWYLENYYRLDTQEAVDSVCDQNGDKGVDGIYIDEANQTIDILQIKISQNPSRTIGDTALKEFYGTLSQFNSKESVQNLIDTAGTAQVVGLVKRLQLLNIIDLYKVRGVFICNQELDANGKGYLTETPEIEFIGKSRLESALLHGSLCA